MGGQDAEAMSIYRHIEGGSDLVDWFGYAPDFHDAEVIELSLHRRGQSILRVHAWRTGRDVNEQGYLVQDKHVIVTFIMEGIMDLQLDGFSHQNVISELVLRAAPDRPDRRPFYALDRSPGDLELELAPCFGLDGRIRCQRLKIEITPGMPTDGTAEA
jgi:hypothetical protein